MNDPTIGKAPRLRRSWYRRRLRNQRLFAGSLLVLVIAVVCWQSAAHFLPVPSLHASNLMPESFWARANFHEALAMASPRGTQRPRYVARVPGVYPYSVVPGGVKSPEALREAVSHDRAVSRHYRDFDFSKARLMRVTDPREVYVSYRIRDTVFWTHKKIRLLQGELLLTDGKITARAKCGNQISETAKPDVSDQEPDEAVLDQPVALEPLGPSLPLRVTPARFDLPPGRPSTPAFLGSQISFPLVTFAGAPAAVCRFEDGVLDRHCHAHHKKPTVPEPASLILLASGLAMIAWRYRSLRLVSA